MEYLKEKAATEQAKNKRKVKDIDDKRALRVQADAINQLQTEVGYPSGNVVS